MKLRVRGSSLRLRLTRSEVDALRDRGFVEETTPLLPSPLVYRIERGAGPRVAVRFESGCLAIVVPEALATDFCNTDRVGFEETSEGVRVLVEKDWQCLAPRDEDESDAFPHPRGES